MTSDAIEIGDEASHTSAGIADRTPLAGRVGHLPLLHEPPVLRALEVGRFAMPAHGVHDVAGQFRLEALLLEQPVLHCNPLVQPHEVRDDPDQHVDLLPMVCVSTILSRAGQVGVGTRSAASPSSTRARELNYSGTTSSWLNLAS